MITKILDYVKKNQMIQNGDHILIGISGGADSVCLLLVLQKLQQFYDFSLEAVHVEHGIRGEESMNDADFVRKFCHDRKVPLTIQHVDVPSYCKESKLGTEESARILRYQVFAQVAHSSSNSHVKLALAHHMDDNAETILFQMIRGSGLTGMCGMKPMRQEGDMCYIRPMLCITRGEIEDYLNCKNQEFCIDATNEDVTYSRNRIRGVIIPELEKVNGQAIAHINQTAERLMDIESYICLKAEEAFENCAGRKKDETYICISKLNEYPMAIQQEIIRKAIFLCAGKRKDITAIHVRDLLRLTNQQSGKRVQLPYQIEAWKEYDEIRMKEKETRNASQKLDSKIQPIEISTELLEELRTKKMSKRIVLDESGTYLEFEVREFHGNQEEIPKKAYTKWLDYDMIKIGFSIRNRLSGDYFYTDSKGHRKKLKEYFINEKIPSSVRDEIPLLAHESEIIWIIGGRISETYKVTGETKYILEIHYNGGKG